MNTHFYEHMHVYLIPMSTSEKLSDLILRFTKSVTKNISLSMETSSPTKKIINRKYNTHVKSMI
jgi:hypothetical protein